MNKNLKIMIAYDGQNHSEAAIDDLQFAGLPRLGDALIVSVHDSVASSALFDAASVENSAVSARVLQTSRLLQKESANNFAVLLDAVDESIKDVGFYLPEWNIESKILNGNPLELLQLEADLWKPDLLIVGSHKRTAFGRFFLGSVSIELARRLNCSVRVAHNAARQTFNSHPRVIAVIDDSAKTKSVIRQIGNRVWSSETNVRLIVFDDEFAAHEMPKILNGKQLMLEWAVEQLQIIGLNVSVEFINQARPNALLDAAAEWNADSIYVAAEKPGEDDAELAEPIMNLITKAACTVEIVR